MTVVRLLLYFVVLFGAGASLANDASSLDVAVMREGDCFRYDSHESWMEFIRSRQQDDRGPAISKEEYDRYRASLDCSFFSYTVDGVEVAGFSARPRSTARLIPDYAANKQSALRTRSPLFVASELAADTPILILHGNADDRAQATNALQLAMKLQELKRPYKLVVYPDGDHSLGNFRSEVRSEISAWLEAHLKAGDRP